jgi:heme o synthase
LLIGTAMVAGSAGAANQVWERRIDCNMPRTAVRPLPSERMSVGVAVAFTALIGILGTVVLGFAFGSVPALVGVATWVLYVLVYTPLKTRTAWNTTVGAIAGALPILIGYTALGGSLADPEGWLLVGVLVTWQYPHFMAIAWMYRHQYADAGFQMTTTVEPTGRSAGIQGVVGSLALIGCGLGLCIAPTQLPSTILSAVAIVAVVYPMLRASIRFARHRDDVQARRLLRSSLLVLPAVLLIVTLRVFW